jgi:uncharacterized membrane protein YebE (DUF533 family)
MKKILSIIALGGLGFVIYKQFQKAKSTQKDVKLVQQ